MLTRTFCGRFLQAAALLAASTPGAASWAKEPDLRPFPGKTPPLRLTSIEGKEWKLDALRGKVVVLNFWASWCGPCVEELPVLNELATGSKVVVIGVNYKESADAIERFTQAHPFGYPVVRDRTGEAFNQWTGGVMPTTIVIDRNGRARWRLVGELEPGAHALRQAIDKLVSP
jgi:thiol-disulfide isomerase/thioredoxin